MSSFKEYWDRSGDQENGQDNQAKGFTNCTNTERDCSSGYVCLYGECTKATDNTGSDWCPVENYDSSCSGCGTGGGGGDPECRNGIITRDFDGTIRCVSKKCDNASPCPAGYSCQQGICQPSNCVTSSDCASGYSCQNGICNDGGGLDEPCGSDSDCQYGFTCNSSSNTCRPSDCTQSSQCAEGYSCVNGTCDDSGLGGPCSANIDCNYGQYCRGGRCEDVDVEPPLYPISGNTCSNFCTSYYAENGQLSEDCAGKTCGDCYECFSGVCQPNKTDCECKTDLPRCVVCSLGQEVLDCSCFECTSVGSVSCSCGKVLPPQQYCKSSCESGLGSASGLNQQIQANCSKACQNSEGSGDCDGVCSTVTVNTNNYSCPIGLVCQLVGVISVGDQTQYIYRNCNPSIRPEYCEDTPVARKHIALSVIDEDDSYKASPKANDWRQFRQVHPDTIFVVLVPNKGNGVVTSPPGFDGLRQTISLTANWASVMSGPLANATSCRAFIDNSGSMTVGDVAGSLSQFGAYCAANGISFSYTSNGTENWIRPHI